jgi:hypothetical protein
MLSDSPGSTREFGAGNTSRAGWATTALMALSTGAGGLVLWIASINAVNEAYLALFLPLSAISTFAVAAFSRTHVAAITFPMGAVPMVASLWTAPRGDGDGLWILIVPLLAFWAGILLGIALVARRTLSLTLKRRGDVGGAMGVVRSLLPIFLGLSISLIAVLLLFNRTAGPWSSMQEMLETYSPPSGFEKVGWQRAGDALCTERVCAAELSLVMRSDLPLDGQCELLGSSLQAWPGVKKVDNTTATAAGEFYGQKKLCEYSLTYQSDDSTEMLIANIAEEKGKPREIRVTALDPSLT